MPVRLRLQRQGRKKQPFYFIVAADSRSPRDGKFLDKIGTYDPTKVPANIELNNDKALVWLDKGAQPSDTVHKILSYKGVLYKKHLLRGVKKGAFSIEEAETRYQEWLDSKSSAITSKKSNIALTLEQAKKDKNASEQKKREEKAKVAAEALAAAQTAEEEAAKAAEQEVAATAAPQEEAPNEDTPTEEATQNEEPAADAASADEKPAAE